MLLKQTSIKFRKEFLLRFTEHLIKNSSPVDIYRLEATLKDKKVPLNKKFISQAIKEKRAEEFKIKKQKPILNKIPGNRPRKIMRRPIKRVLRIPKTRLPKTMQYLKPTPSNINLDLGKLNVLVKDPQIRDIECNGQDTPLIVKGPSIGTKTSKIILNKDEIDFVIKKFSEEAKIPIQEGFSKVVVGKMILSAIVSKVTGSRFLIKKMVYQPIFK